ncbi:MAG TPA: carbohydrate porin [candidate division Zixibacteria bacterium]|nr:carbohydrate porin [candidate division Zixibacteria bacterium]
MKVCLAHSKWLRRIVACFCLAGALLTASPRLFAQTDPAPETEQQESPVTLFPHSETAPWWISGQVNVIFQAHPDFSAKYSGPNSLHDKGENASSRVLTLYLGFQPAKGQEFLLDVEETGGKGISNALGLAGFTNLDVVRNPAIGQQPYIARAMYHYTMPLSGEELNFERGPLSMPTSVPARRLEFRIGKFSTADFFDVNSVGSDSHLQFMNWTVDNNGAYDYAADTRGYTYGAIVEYEDHNWGVRFGETLMPKVANGQHLDADLTRARAENIEFEFRPQLLCERKTVLRALSYVNHADMGTYRTAVNRYLAGIDARPIIENTRKQGTIKYGFGLNGEQEITANMRGFFRLGWDEGKHESFAYTEVNSTAEFGGDYAGSQWHRKFDKIGVAFVTNGISADHQAYLRNGGLGFLLGDGNLNYGRENIVEMYYTLHLWRGLFFSFDLQHINNPGYNRDRGPVTVPALRMHLDL